MVSNVNDVTLEESELVALADLVRVMAGLDGDITPQESDEIALIAREVGVDGFWAAFDKSTGHSATVADLEKYAAAVKRRPAQELIHTLLEELADADGIDGDQKTVLDNLRHAWALED
jgi:hypothetical protein